jgi:prevent-host-death family protein
MYSMRSATIREVQHNISKVLREVEAGEEIIIRRRSRAIAKLVPLSAPKPGKKANWSGHRSRLRKVYGGRLVTGKPASEIVDEGRGDR